MSSECAMTLLVLLNPLSCFKATRSWGQVWGYPRGASASHLSYLVNEMLQTNSKMYLGVGEKAWPPWIGQSSELDTKNGSQNPKLILYASLEPIVL